MKRKSLAWLLSLVLVFSLFTALAAPANAASYYQNADVGEEVWWTYDVYMMTDAYIVSGSLPPGMSLGQNQDCFIVKGAATAAGTYTAYIYCEVEGGHDEEMTVTIAVSEGVTPSPAPTQAPETGTQAPATATPAPAAFAITKQPTRETVTVGGSAAFSANAQNYSWCAWRFMSPDGKTEVIFDVTEPHFPG